MTAERQSSWRGDYYEVAHTPGYVTDGRVTLEADPLAGDDLYLKHSKLIETVEKELSTVRKRGRKQQSTETCYMCDKPGTTREHSPPIGFFPNGRRANLITVPSCKTHNNDNSFNVEYTRNIIVTDIHTNDVAREMFAEKVLPSYKRGHKLRRLTFQQYTEVKVDGLDSAIVHIQNSRFNPIMKAIANALFFHDYGEPYKYRWMVYRATAQHLDGRIDNINPQIRAFLRSIEVDGRAINQPEVFNYGVYRDAGIEHRIVYKLVFYGGVDIYTIGIPKDSDVW